MSARITAQPLTAEAFAPYGDVLEATGQPDKMINQGRCGRFHDLARLDFTSGAAGISLFQSECFSLPLKVEMVERHPLGSQAFIPMHEEAYLVVVAENSGNGPVRPQAFLAAAGQAINIHRNTWHGVLTPLSPPGLFAVIDRVGEGDNLEEYWFDDPVVVVP